MVVWLVPGAIVLLLLIALSTPEYRAILKGVPPPPRAPRPMSLKSQPQPAAPKSYIERVLRGWAISVAVVFFGVLIGGPILVALWH